MDRAELAAWLRLLETPGVGRESARRLLAAFGTPQAVFDVPTNAWRDVAGGRAAEALAVSTDEAVDTHRRLVDATLAWLAAAEDAPRTVVTLGDRAYPRALLETADPPLLLYAHGDLGRLQADALAVVGSRNPTPQGVDNARAFAAELSRRGLTIVSGLALGIDAAAHAGGLDGPGATIAVVGTGLDQAYPRRNTALARRIAARGLMLSEFALGTPPLAPNFPVRNRIIAGLARGTLVVEAALQSGSLITARLAVEAGRDVYAIPGSIHSPQSRGCHALIKQGAKLVETAQDVLEELSMPSAGDAGVPPATSAAKREDPLLAALGHDPLTLDALVDRTGLPAATLNARLLELELDGRVARLPGQRFQRVAHG